MIRGTHGQGGQSGGSTRLSSSTHPMNTGAWSALNDEQRGQLRNVARARVYPARSPLVHQGREGDHVIVIEDGWVKVTSDTFNGDEVLLYVRGPGDLIGENVLFGTEPSPVTITALTPVRCLVLSAARFKNFLDEHLAVWQLICRLLVQRQEETDLLLRVLLSSKGTERLAGLLAQLGELSARHGPPDQDGYITIAPPLTQYELARWLDASRETVARSLQALRTRGLVRTGRRKMAVNLSGLREYLDDAQREGSRRDCVRW